MAGSLNKMILIGRLGADPDVRRLSSGDAVVNLSIATSESWKDKNSGERREKTEWHKVVIFNEHLGKVAEQYLKKGAQVYLEGQLQTRSWDDQSGQKKYATEIVLQRYRGELQMLDGPSGGNQQQSPSPASDNSGGDYRQESGGFGGQSTGGAIAGSYGDMDSEIPF